jgi:hypothetical protein
VARHGYSLACYAPWRPFRHSPWRRTALQFATVRRISTGRSALGRRNPLSGTAADWAEYKGTSAVQPLLQGHANFVDLSVAGSRGKIEGGSLRLYNPKAGQWSLNYVSIGGGVLTAPVFGAFDGKGRGLFYGQDTLDGRTIMVRFIITQVSPREAHFEQAYSTDGGQSWEDNWIAVDTRR